MNFPRYDSTAAGREVRGPRSGRFSRGGKTLGKRRAPAPADARNRLRAYLSAGAGGLAPSLPNSIAYAAAMRANFNACSAWLPLFA